MQSCVNLAHILHIEEISTILHIYCTLGENLAPILRVDTSNAQFVQLAQNTISQQIKTTFNYRSSGSGQNSVIPVVCDVPE